LRADATAELIAVRALETLRAALIQFARRAECAERPYSEVVKRFVRVDVVLPQPPPPPPLPVVVDRAAEEPAAELPSLLHVWLGGLFLVNSESGDPGWGGSGQLFVGRGWLSVGGRFSGLFSPLELKGTDSAVGSAEVSRFAAELELKAQLRLGQRASYFFQAGGGLAVFPVYGLPGTGFEGRHATLTSPVLSAETGAVFQVSNETGIYASIGSSLSTRAPQIRLAGQEVATLDQPMIALYLGIAAGAL
jgi:hypothetical protein